MGSLEEERLWQMVHDFIEAEPATPTHFPHYSLPNQTTSRCFTLQEILKEDTEAEAQIGNRIRFHMRKKMEMEKTTKLKRWLATCLSRDGFDASLCHTSWLTTHGCPCGNYEFIDMLVGGEGKRVIIDIDFKSQFEVARPTKSYMELSSILPPIFVGGEEKLRKVVKIMCMAAEESMKERGLHIPPWRKFCYMTSKWLSTCKREANSETKVDEVANKRDPPAHMRPMRRGMGGAHRSGLCSHFASMEITY